MGAKCRVDRKWFFVVSAGVAITLPFCYFPSFYAQNGNPPARSLIVPGAILIGYLAFGGYALSAFALRLASPSRVAVAAMLALVPIGVAALSLPELANAAHHAALWDAEDQPIPAAPDPGLADLSVPPLPPYLGQNFLPDDPEDLFHPSVA